MQMEQMIMNETVTIREVLQRLEKERCRIVYIVRKNKLIGSVSEGDIRRYLINQNDVERNAADIMNRFPIAFYENQKKEIKQIFESSELYSVPIINYNHEIIAICFRNSYLKKKQEILNIPVVIMAGGKGTRLYPYTKILPKALVPIGDIPIVEHIINRLNNSGCKDFYLVVNHKKNMIKSYMDGVEKKYNIFYADEEEPLGTGGGLSLLKNRNIDEFILSNCDILIDADYKLIYDFHKQNNNFITIVAAKKHNRIPYGVLEVENGRLIDMQEKPEQVYIVNTGMYVVDGKIFDMIADNERVDFTELISRCQDQGYKIGVYTIEEKAYMDMGQLEEMEKMKEQLGYKGVE